MNWLIKDGFDLNCRNDKDETVLHLVIYLNDEPAIVKEILSKGVLCYLKNQDGDAPIHYAGRYAMNPELVSLLVKAGADVNDRNYYGQTPLTNAAEGGRMAAAIRLLELGASASLPDYAGLTPLHYAAKEDNPDFAAMLLEHGANLYAKTDKGETPLDVARKYQRTKMVQWLEEKQRASPLPAVTDAK